MARKNPEIKPQAYDQIVEKLQKCGLEIFRVVNGEYDIVEAPDEAFHMIINGKKVFARIHLWNKEQYDDEQDEIMVHECEEKTGLGFSKNHYDVAMDEFNNCITVDEQTGMLVLNF